MTNCSIAILRKKLVPIDESRANHCTILLFQMEVIFGLCSLDFIATSLTTYKSSPSYVALRSDGGGGCADSQNTTAVSFANYVKGVSTG